MQFLMAWIRKFWGVRQSTGQPYAPTSVPVGPPTYPRLYPLRLSERRMMDAAAWVNLTDAGVLQLSAGNASNDGHVDTFTIGRAATDANSSPGTAAQIEVRINDQSPIAVPANRSQRSQFKDPRMRMSLTSTCQLAMDRRVGRTCNMYFRVPPRTSA